MFVPPATTTRRSVAGHGVAKRTAATVLLAVLSVGGVAGCAITSEAVDPGEPIEVVEPGLEDSVAYGYFGAIQIAPGNTIETTISNIDSRGDIEVLETPDGVTASISEDDDGVTHLELKIADDAARGTQTLTFEIVGEPEIVSWMIQIT